MFGDVPAWRLSDAAALEAMLDVSRALVARLAERGAVDEIRAVRETTKVAGAGDRTAVLTRAVALREQLVAER